jgi:hypothetical protein
MTTQEFIYKALLNTTKKDSCSSVFKEKNWNDDSITIYSYGRHYPLVKIINGNAYVNNQGYSNSTAKHINWAFSASADIVGYNNVYGVKLQRGDSLTLKGIENSSRKELENIRNTMASKKRKDTMVYKMLETDEVRVMQTLMAVTQ